MVTVSRRVLLPLLALILVPPVFSVLAPNPIQAGETPSFLLATATPPERLSPSVAWLDDLEHRLTTYFTKKYPAYDFSPYAQELDRIRGAVSPARIIHERFCCNRRSAAATSLRPAGSPLGPSPYCTSTHRVLTAPRAGLGPPPSPSPIIGGGMGGGADEPS
jgi:hypothetical protein